MPNRRFSLLLLLVVTTLACIAAALKTPFSTPMATYVLDAQEWVRQGFVADTFMPLAYPLFLIPAFRLAGNDGIIVEQLLLQLGIVVVCYAILRRQHLPEIWSAVGALPIALHPDLLFSVTKVWDLAFSTFLVLLLVYGCMRLAARPSAPSWRFTVVFAFSFGVALFCRPNLSLLWPLLLLLMLNRGRIGIPKSLPGSELLRCLTFVVIAALSFAGLGQIAHGAPFFPRNGPYNLYAGHNVDSRAALLAHLNAEPSIIWALAATHPEFPQFTADSPELFTPALAQLYVHDSISFAAHHPVQEVELAAIKLLTFFRPDTRLHSVGSFLGFLKVLQALPVFFLVLALLYPGRPRLQASDWVLFWIEALYLLPFLLTNSDPRFRLPFDAIVLLHTATLLFRRFASAKLAEV